MQLKKIRIVKLLKFLAILSLTMNSKAFDFESQYSRPSVDEIEKVIGEFTLIGFKWIDQPINKVLLIKNGQDHCAIKILSYKMFNDKKDPTIFSANEESFLGEATFVTFKNGKSYKFKTLHLSSKSPVGIGKIAYDSSQDIIRCGKARLLWRYPSAISLLSESNGTNLSPTANEDFNELNFNSTNLRWYSYDESRKMELIPISELPIAQ